MKNNIIKTTFICMGALALTACSDWLDTKSDSIQDESQVFSSLEQTKLAVNGLYNDLCSDVYTQLMTIHQGAGTDVELIDGIGATATGQNSERDGMNYNATTSWAKLGTLWEEQFATIEECNRIIDGINDAGANSTEMQKCADEARVIRAMVYLDLIRVFGDVPMMMEKAQSDLSNVNVGKTDRDVILDELISDLKEVVGHGYIPWCGEVTSEHINMGYTKGLLANILMTRAGYAIRENDGNSQATEGGFSSSKKLAAGYVKADYSSDEYMTLRPADSTCIRLYKEAKEQLEDIKNKGIHKMNDSFANEWYNVNQLVLDQTYYENMFEIPVGFSNAGELGYTVGVRMNGNTKDYGNYNSSGKLKTTAVMLYSYQPTDTRRDITCVNYEIKDQDRTATSPAKDTVTVQSRLSNKPFGLYIGKWDVQKMSQRWKTQNLSASSKFGYGINTIRMRYPQILLWLAECDVQLNNLGVNVDLSAAKSYIKDVHERAFKDATTSYTGRTVQEDIANFEATLGAATTADAVMDLIDEENKLEFCGENFRKWDLIRWNRLHQDIWKAKRAYLYLQNKGMFVTKIFFKYLDDKEKNIDWSSATWYGEDGYTGFNTCLDIDDTHAKVGADIATSDGGKQNYDWLDQRGYPVTKEGYEHTGKGTDHKDLNGFSYSGTVFGTDYANKDLEFPTICSGLVGSQNPTSYTQKCEDKDVTVKNRYLMPIYSNVVNSSIGSDKKQRVYNSYGY